MTDPAPAYSDAYDEQVDALKPGLEDPLAVGHLLLAVGVVQLALLVVLQGLLVLLLAVHERLREQRRGHPGAPAL